MIAPNKTVPCPFCHAQVGAGCVNEDGSLFKTGIHMARFHELNRVRMEREAIQREQLNG
jgi:hypothetical protein